MIPISIELVLDPASPMPATEIRRAQENSIRNNLSVFCVKPI